MGLKKATAAHCRELWVERPELWALVPALPSVPRGKGGKGWMCDGWMHDRWMHGDVEGYVDACVDTCMCGGMHGLMHSWMDG